VPINNKEISFPVELLLAAIAGAVIFGLLAICATPMDSLILMPGLPLFGAALGASAYGTVCAFL